MLPDAAWVWLSPLLIMLGCMGLLWSFRSRLRGLGTTAVGASGIRSYWNKLQRIEILGIDATLVLGYLFVYVPVMLFMFAVIAILGTLALAGFLKLAELTGFEALLEYINRQF